MSSDDNRQPPHPGKKADKADGTYISEGLCIGLCLGVALGRLLFDNLALGIGMCIGLAVGAGTKKKDKTGTPPGDGPREL